jgi:hypothetical protein
LVSGYTFISSNVYIIIEHGCQITGYWQPLVSSSPLSLTPSPSDNGISNNGKNDGDVKKSRRIHLLGAVDVIDGTSLWIDYETIEVTGESNPSEPWNTGYIRLGPSTSGSSRAIGLSSLLITPSSSIRNDLIITNENGLINGIPVRCDEKNYGGIRTLNSESLLIIPSHITKMPQCSFTGFKTPVLLAPSTTLDLVSHSPSSSLSPSLSSLCLIRDDGCLLPSLPLCSLSFSLLLRSIPFH